MMQLIYEYNAYRDIDPNNPDVSMSELLNRSRQNIKDYKLDVEPEKDRKIINPEPAENMIPQIIEYTAMLKMSYKKEEADKKEPEKQQEPLLGSNLMANSIFEENKDVNMNININTNMKLKETLIGQP